MYDPRNPYSPGTAEHATWEVSNTAQERRAAEFEASGPMTFTRSLASLVVWGGLFALGLWGSMGAFKAVGRILLIGCVALFAIAIAVAAYIYLVRPLFRLTGLAWSRNVLVRSVMVGGALGIGSGAWLGYSMHELLRGIIRLGVMGAVLGLIVGLLLLFVGKASKRPVS